MWDEIVNDLGLDMRGKGGINHNKKIHQTKELRPQGGLHKKFLAKIT